MSLRRRRLRALSSAAVVAGFVCFGLPLEGDWPAYVGFSLIVLGCLLRPLKHGLAVVKRRLDLAVVRSLADADLDVFEALVYEGRKAPAKTVQAAAAALGLTVDEAVVLSSLAALVHAGLVFEESRDGVHAYGPALEARAARDLLADERERRLKRHGQRPGSRSRLSGLAERLAL